MSPYAETPTPQPMAVYLKTLPDEVWCPTRRGVVWPTLGLWVDRLELLDDDAPPDGYATYPLIPDVGLDLALVHGQVDPEGVSHVLVTGTGGQVITQGSARCTTDTERALLVLATLIAAVGYSATPGDLYRACATDEVLHDLQGKPWAAPGGWSQDVKGLPGRVVNNLGLDLYSPVHPMDLSIVAPIPAHRPEALAHTEAEQ